MHIATVHRPVDWSHKIGVGSYLLEDHNSAELLWASRGFGEVTLQSAEPHKYDPKNLWKPGAKNLIVRVGGFGDLLWLNPIYQAMRQAGAQVYHSCFLRYLPVLEGYIDGFIPYPLDIKSLAGFDNIVWLENSIEGKACLGGEHPADRLQAMLGVSEDVNIPRAAYTISESEKDWATNTLPEPITGRRVCVQVAPSHGGKGYPHILQLMAMLHTKGWDVLVVGEPRKEREHSPVGVIDCTQTKNTIRQNIALASKCDAIIAADSVFVHIGGALEIPTVGLFGPFSGKAYMAGYKGTALQGRGACSPCSWHPRGSAFPPEGPCNATGHCNALANIPPSDIIAALNNLVKK